MLFSRLGLGLFCNHRLRRWFRCNFPRFWVDHQFRRGLWHDGLQRSDHGRRGLRRLDRGRGGLRRGGWFGAAAMSAHFIQNPGRDHGQDEHVLRRRFVAKGGAAQQNNQQQAVQAGREQKTFFLQACHLISAGAVFAENWVM